MSETTDFYASWLGNNAFGNSGVRIRDQEPIDFKPTDISGCRFWLDANDGFTVNYNNLLEVSSWSNKGTLGGQFDISGGLVQYGTAKVNGLNTVSFKTNGFLAGQFALNFQPRSIFLVTRPNTIPDASACAIFSSDTTNCQETFYLRTGGVWTFFDGKHPSPVPQQAFESSTDYLGYAFNTEFIVGTDLSDNWSGINGTYITPIYQATASYSTSSATYFLGNFFGGVAYDADIDFCEIIIYDGALNIFDRLQVEQYLRTKWKLAEPVPPPYELIGEWDFNNYASGDPVITNTIAGGSATINEYSSCTFDNTTSGNYNLQIYAPNNFPSNTAGITLPDLSGVSAIECWVQYVDNEVLNYSQYFIDARTGATNGYWITEGYAATDIIGDFYTDAKIYFNTLQYSVDVIAQTPTIGPILLNNGWTQVVIVPKNPINDDIALFMRYTGIQGMPVMVADICAYTNPISQSDIVQIFNSKCSRYGLSPI